MQVAIFQRATLQRATLHLKVELTWIAIDACKGLSDFDSIRKIEPQYSFCDATNRGHRQNGSALNFKMFVPSLHPRIEQRKEDFCHRISRRDVRSLKAIAVETRPSQILEYCFTTVLRGDNMVRFMRKPCILFRNQTLLAAATRSFLNLPTQSRRNPPVTHGAASTYERARALTSCIICSSWPNRSSSAASCSVN